MQVLDLSYHSQLTDDAVMGLLDHITSLHTLCLNGCFRVSDNALAQLTEDRRPNFPYVELKTAATPGAWHATRRDSMRRRACDWL